MIFALPHCSEFLIPRAFYCFEFRRFSRVRVDFILEKVSLHFIYISCVFACNAVRIYMQFLVPCILFSTYFSFLIKYLRPVTSLCSQYVCPFVSHFNILISLPSCTKFILNCSSLKNYSLTSQVLMSSNL
jgi:hypothetical protein